MAENNKRIEYIAKSFLNIARAEENVDGLEKELRSLKDLIVNNAKLKELLMDNTILLEDKISNLRQAIGVGASQSIKAVLSIIVSLRLFEEIEDILKNYSNLLNSLKKQVDVEVVSAVELDKKTIEKIKRKVDKKTGFNTRIINTVDREILGGIIIQFRDQILDLSLKGKLVMLKDNLKSIDLRGEKFGA